MEWYICLLIEEYKHKTVFIHAGLYHTEKVNNLLDTIYKFKKIYKTGINTLYETDNSKNVCQLINDNF